MKELMICRIAEMKIQSNYRFSEKTHFGEKITDIDINNVSDTFLLGLFEVMVKIHYTQR